MKTVRHNKLLYRLIAFFLICMQLLSCQPPKIHTQSNPNAINVSQMPNLMDEPAMPAALRAQILAQKGDPKEVTVDTIENLTKTLLPELQKTSQKPDGFNITAESLPKMDCNDLNPETRN